MVYAVSTYNHLNSGTSTGCIAANSLSQPRRSSHQAQYWLFCGWSFMASL